MTCRLDCVCILGREERYGRGQEGLGVLMPRVHNCSVSRLLAMMLEVCGMTVRSNKTQPVCIPQKTELVVLLQGFDIICTVP